MTTKIHQACESAGHYIITADSCQPKVVLSRLLDALEVLAPAVHQQVTMPACGFAMFPEHALEDELSAWWNGDDGKAALDSLFEALNEHAPEGFGVMPDQDYLRLGFWPIAETVYYTCLVPFSEHGTEWHPTDRDFAPLTRGNFDSVAKADAWAAEKLAGQPYSVRAYNKLSGKPVDEQQRPSGVVPALRDAPASNVLDTMFAWHGGQGCALYAAASNWLGGHTVSLETARRALEELERCSLQPNFTADNAEALEELREHVEGES